MSEICEFWHFQNNKEVLARKNAFADLLNIISSKL